MRRRAERGLLVLLVAGVLAGATACTGGTPTGAHRPETPSGPASVTAMGRPPVVPSTTRAPTPTAASDPVVALSLAQRVGQLFIVGTPATTADPAALDAVRSRHAGGIFLSGRSTAGAAVSAAIVARFAAADSDGHPLFVATDQEGGEVQVLRGPGLSVIPSALDQAAVAPDVLRADATGWGRELRSAGVNMDLAPVTDVVDSSAAAAGNPPIGRLDREYGYGAQSVADHAGAFANGIELAGVIPVVKHFPGLGAVTQNTDYASSVTDGSTDASSPSVAAFASLVQRKAPAVMISSAIYSKLDATQPAVFSPVIVTKLLRGALGFGGVVITDDVSASAQLRAWSPADRAIRAIDAGVDVVLVSAAPGQAAAMIDAVLARAQTDAAFAARVDAACARVLELKRQYLQDPPASR